MKDNSMGLDMVPVNRVGEAFQLAVTDQRLYEDVITLFKRIVIGVGLSSWFFPTCP